MKKILILTLILAFCTFSQGAVLFQDNFDHAMMGNWDRINYQGWYMQNVLGNPYPGGPWTKGSYDGYQSLPDPSNNVSPTMIAYNYVNTFPRGRDEGPVDAWTPGYTGEVANGVLKIVSSNSGWSDTWNTGPFLYKNITGDFQADIQVVGSDDFWHNLGGLMARAANPSGAGATENWVALDYFPVWGVGNHSRNTIMGASTESPNKGYPGDPYLRLTRLGSKFYLETSPDGVTYASLPGLEAGISRPDLPSELQVGIFQANFTGDWIGSMDFDNLVIQTPEPATIALLGLGSLALIRRKR